jgi:hypothetical protein
MQMLGYPKICVYRWARYVARMGKKRNAYRILIGKPKGNRPPGTRKSEERMVLKLIVEK